MVLKIKSLNFRDWNYLFNSLLQTTFNLHVLIDLLSNPIAKTELDQFLYVKDNPEPTWLN